MLSDWVTVQWVSALFPVVTAPPASPAPSWGFCPTLLCFTGLYVLVWPSAASECSYFWSEESMKSKLDKTGSHHGSQLPAPWPQFTHLEMAALVSLKSVRALLIAWCIVIGLYTHVDLIWNSRNSIFNYFLQIQIYTFLHEQCWARGPPYSPCHLGHSWCPVNSATSV